jgi:hypothetical protein
MAVFNSINFLALIFFRKKSLLVGGITNGFRIDGSSGWQFTLKWFGTK